MIELRCPTCATALTFPVESQGQGLPCPRCGTLVGVGIEHAKTVAVAPAGDNEPDQWATKAAPTNSHAEPAETFTPPELDHITVPGYQIIGELGRGGMGVVYKARQVKLGRVVALKMILAGGHASAADLERFRAEAQSVARLQHPNVVQIHEVGEHQGQPFFSLEFVEGGSLDRRLRGTPMTAAESGRLTETLAHAVEAAHAKGIVHRDLKPANVLLTPDGTPKISDFGLAKQLDADAGPTVSGAILGTPSYMAPEQATGDIRKISPATDVWALGAMLYEFLTGRPPFRAANPMETILHVVNEEPVPPTRLQPKLPRDLESVCLKCLQKDPRRRYASAAALAGDLRRYLDGQPTEARPIGWGERTWKWMRRHPAATAWLTVLVAAAVGLMVLLDAARRDAEDRSRTEHQLRAETDVQRLRAVRGKEEAEHARRKLAEEQRETARQLDLARRSAFTAQVWVAAGLWRKEPQHGRALLDDQHVCPLDLRDFAWGFYRRLCNRGQATLRGHTGTVAALALSTDGNLLASASHDGTVKLWEMPAGRLKATLAPDHGEAWCVALSGDGSTVAAGFADGSVLAWDTATEEPRRLPEDRHIGPVWGVALTKRGDHIASCSGKLDKSKSSSSRWTRGEVAWWDVAQGGRRLLHGNEARGYFCIAIDPKGKLVAAGNGSTQVHLWDVSAATPAPAGTIKAGTGWVQGLAFAPDGKQLIVASADFTIKLFNPESRRLVTGINVLRGHINEVWAVAVDPAGRYFASSGWDGIKLWNLKNRDEELLTLRVNHPTHVDKPTLAVALSRNGLLAVPSGNDVEVWSVAQRTEYGAALRTTSHGVVAVALAPDGRTVASGSREKEVKLWDREGSAQPRTLGTHPEAIVDVVFAPDGAALASVSRDLIRVWDMPAGKERLTFRRPGQVVRATHWSPDGRLLVATSPLWDEKQKEGTLTVWDVAAGREVRTLRGAANLLQRDLPRHDGKPLPAAFAPAGRTLAVVTWSPVSLVLFDLHTGESRTLPMEAKTSMRPQGLVYSPDGRWIALCVNTVSREGSQQGLVRVWETATGKEQMRIALLHPLWAVAFTADSLSVAMGGDERTIQLWDVTTQQQRASLKGHQLPISSLCFSADGKTLVSGGGPREASYWIKHGEVLIWDGTVKDDAAEGSDPPD